MPTNSLTNRTNTSDKGRSQTVRLPATGVRRRETLDPVPGGMSIRKVDNNSASDKPKTPTGDTYVFYVHKYLSAWFLFVCCDCLHFASIVPISKVVSPVYLKG